MRYIPAPRTAPPRPRSAHNTATGVRPLYWKHYGTRGGLCASAACTASQASGSTTVEVHENMCLQPSDRGGYGCIVATHIGAIPSHPASMRVCMCAHVPHPCTCLHACRREEPLCRLTLCACVVFVAQYVAGPRWTSRTMTMLHYGAPNSLHRALRHRACRSCAAVRATGGPIGCNFGRLRRPVGL